MSVTIKQSPQAIMPVYNPIVFTVDSTNKTQCQFNYICDVYVNGSYITRLKRLPSGLNGYADFEVNRVLEDYISYDLKHNLLGTTLFGLSTNSIINYSLHFGEEYDNSVTCDVGTTVTANMTNTTGFSAINAALQYREWLDWDYTDYIPSIGNEFLTNTPDNVLINYGAQMVHNVITATGYASGLQVKTYSDTGSQLGTYSYSIGVGLTSSLKILSVGVGPANLNGTILATGSQPVITANVGHYTIQLVNVGGSTVSELRTIKIDKRFSKHGYNRFWFLNRLGGFDSYTYTLSDVKKLSIDRNEYTRIYGAYQASPATWTYQAGNRGKTTLNVTGQQSNTYTSNWLTETESIWMGELFTSPEVYMISANKELCFTHITYYDITECETMECLPDYYIAIPGILGTVGSNIYVNFGSDPYFGYKTGTYSVYSHDSGQTVIYLGTTCVGTAFPPSCIAEGVYELCGLAYSLTAELDPVIVKSSSYEEKVKVRTKNINYSIDVEKAYPINIQRN